MPSLQLPDRLIWFAHCPKAGGTSIEQVMVSRWGGAVGHLQWGWTAWWRQGGWRLADPPNSPQHLVWEDALAQLPVRPDMVFALVRDPIDRMASEYRWQRRIRAGTPLGRALAYLPFFFWLRTMFAAADRHPHVLDNHFRSQSEFVPETARIFRLEDGLDAPLRWLADATGQSVDDDRPPHALTSGPGFRIDARSQSLIARRFADDYERFGYRRPPCIPETRVPVRLAALALARLVVLLDRRGCL